MDNRAVITTESREIGVYLHWNGGRDSVEAFLAYCKNQGFRTPELDCYGWARLVQVIANYIGGDLSVGIDQYVKLDKDNGDNGVYIIKDWEIVGREFAPKQEQMEYDLETMINEVTSAQPESLFLSIEKDRGKIKEELKKLDIEKYKLNAEREKLKNLYASLIISTEQLLDILKKV